jgi:phosphoribosylformimino-5-aminoimidazole carboxamide ribotide isomerase
MIVFAAIDLQQGEVVQLVGGQADSARVRWRDPIAVAQKWVTAGFQALHVVDLDAARGNGSNSASIAAMIRTAGVPIQVGGGVRSDEAIEHWLDLGADRVVVGTRAIEDAAWRKRIAREYPQRVVIAADVHRGTVVTHAWVHRTTVTLTDLLNELEEEPLAAVLVTDVNREGRMTGVDRDLFRSARASTSHPLYAAGGIADNSDVATLKELQVAGAVLGMALYTGAVDVNLVTGVGRE